MIFDITSIKGKGTTICFEALKILKPSTNTESDFRSAIKKSVTRCIEDEGSKREFDVERTFNSAVRKLIDIKRMGYMNPTGFNKINREASNHGRSNSPRKLMQASPALLEVNEPHHLPMLQKSPMLMTKVNKSRMCKLIQASVQVRAASPRLKH